MGIMMTEMRGLHVSLNPEEFYVLSLDCSPFINSLKSFLFFPLSKIQLENSLALNEMIPLFPKAP